MEQQYFEKVLTGEQYNNTQTLPYSLKYNFNKNIYCNEDNDYRNILKDGVLYARNQVNKIQIVEMRSNFIFDYKYIKIGEYYFYITAPGLQIKFNVWNKSDIVEIEPNKFRTISLKVRADGPEVVYDINISEQSDVILLKTKHLF